MGKKKFSHVSLFSGAGGLDIGLEQAGFKTIWANDFDHDACETHRLWSSAKVVEGDIGKVDNKILGLTLHLKKYKIKRKEERGGGMRLKEYFQTLCVGFISLIVVVLGFYVISQITDPFYQAVIILVFSTFTMVTLPFVLCELFDIG